MTEATFRTLSPLDQIELALRECDYDVAFLAANEHQEPIQQLLVLELKDAQNQEYPVRLYYLDEIAEAYLEQIQVELDSSPNKILCFAMNLPFATFSFQHAELASLITACNTLLPAAYLTLGSEEGIILQYRYIHKAHDPDLKVVVEMIDALIAHFRVLMPLFREYFESGVSVEELLTRIKTHLKRTQGAL